MTPITVVKAGGALLDKDASRKALLASIARLRHASPVILVHGGGIQATALAERLGHVPRMIEGRRVTTDLDLDVHLWTTCGALNARLVAAALVQGLPAIGVRAADAWILQVERRPPREVAGQTVDFGWVGDVLQVRIEALTGLLNLGFLPVVSPLGADAGGLLYNVNADTVATAIAAALPGSSLLFAAESGGLRASADPASDLISRIDECGFQAGRMNGSIAGGMIAKLECAFSARRAGIKEVRIVGAEDLHEAQSGTRIV